MNCFAAITLLALAFQSDSTSSIDRIVAGIETRQSHYRNLTFAYDVRVSGQPPLLASNLMGPARNPTEAMSCKFWILDSKDASKLWRLWRRYVKSESGQLKLDQFVSWNGRVSRVYVSDRAIDEGRWGQGYISPVFEPADFQCNTFDNFLFLDLSGLNQSIFDANHLDLLSDRRFRVVGESTGLDGVRVLQLEGKLDSLGVEYSVNVTDTPDFMVLQWKAVSQSEGRELLSYEVSALGHIDGLAYPAEGKFSQAKVGKLPAFTYNFKVTSAEVAEEADRNEWDIDWPAGTIVNDAVSNNNLSIPHDVKELSKALLEKRRNLSESELGVKTAWNWGFLVANSIAVIFLMAIYWWRRRTA